MEESSNQQAESYLSETGHFRVNAEGETTLGDWTQREGGSSRVIETDDGYNVELVIPWVNLKPESGEMVGFDLLVNDVRVGSRQSSAAWRDFSGQAGQTPSVFGGRSQENQKQVIREIII